MVLRYCKLPVLNNKSIASIFIICLTAINYNLIEYLTEKNYPSSINMAYFGGVALLINIIYALTKKKRIHPKAWLPQLFRIIIDGVSVWLFYESFKYLSASSVAIMQRMDIPFLVLISFYAGHNKSSLQFYLSIWAILILLFFVSDATFIQEDITGFLLTISSVALRSTTYIIIKKQSNHEEKSVLNTTYLLGIFIIGILLSGYNHHSLIVKTGHLPIFIAGGITLFCIVQVALKLFSWYSAERARLPFVSGAFVTMIVEMIIEQKVFSFNQIGLSILITGIMITISLNPSTPKKAFTFSRQKKKNDNTPL